MSIWYVKSQLLCYFYILTNKIVSCLLTNKIVSCLLFQLENLKVRLQRWKEVTEREFPDRPDLLVLIPDVDTIDIKKLSDGAVTTDTCNGAQKTRRILVEIVGELGGVVHEQDCFHHLRNVWINGIAKKLSAFMKDYLSDSLEDICSFLRVSPDLATIIYAYHKEFSLTSNYPKGHGELFRDWIIENYPMEFLLHAERSNGNRMDVICMGADAVYNNRPKNVEFLDKRLRITDNANILQENLFIVLSSLEMIAVSRFFSILHVSLVIPCRWLAGNTYKLAKDKWGARSMGRAVDILHTACGEILDDIKLIHDEKYMMNIFDEIAEEIQDFKMFLEFQFKNKKTEFIAKSKTKSVPYSMLIDELFYPKDDDNKDSTVILETVAKLGIEALLRELEDEKKATYKYLSVSGTAFSFDHCPENIKQAMMGMMAVNDLAESSFAGVTSQVQCYGRIGMHAAAGVSDINRNNFLSRPTTKKAISVGKHGLLHNLPEELKITAVMAAMEDAPATRQSNSAAIDAQRAMKRKKEELKKQKELENASDDHIESLIYHSMWDSEACMKTVNDVTTGLKVLKYKKDKLQALKDNIQIRYKGFGWDDWKTQWSHGNVQYTIPELTKFLKDHIKEEKKKKRSIPDKPKVPIPKRKNMPVLGTETKQRAKLDTNTVEAEDEFELKSRKEWKKREAEGIGSVHSKRQKKNAPPVDDTLIKKRIEYYCEFDMDEGGTVKEPRWCGGVVEKICDGTWVITGKMRKCWKVGEAVEVLWDKIPDAGLPACRARVALNPNKWNKDGIDAWRMDLGEYDYGV